MSAQDGFALDAPRSMGRDARSGSGARRRPWASRICRSSRSRDGTVFSMHTHRATFFRMTRYATLIKCEHIVSLVPWRISHAWSWQDAAERQHNRARKIRIRKAAPPALMERLFAIGMQGRPATRIPIAATKSCALTQFARPHAQATTAVLPVAARTSEALTSVHRERCV